MNTHTEPLSATAVADAGLLPRLIRQFISLCTHIPNTLLAFVARFSIAAVFWKSGQTKIQGFAVDLVNREFTLGWPRLSDSVVDLFRDEYRLPLIPPVTKAQKSATGLGVCYCGILVTKIHQEVTMAANGTAWQCRLSNGIEKSPGPPSPALIINATVQK